MRKSRFLPLFLGLVLALTAVSTASAQGKVLVIPKGTKVQKLGPGNFKLTMPNGTSFILTSYKKGAGTGASAIIGDCGIYDARGVLIAKGSNAVLKGSARAIIGDSGKPGSPPPPTEYIKIDDEVTWLPATITFPSWRIFDRTELLKLNPQPEPPLQKH